MFIDTIGAIYREQEQIAKSWVDFVSKGTIPQDVRPMIAESWIRCKEKGLNGWGSPYLEMRNTTGELNKRLQRRRWLLDACMAIMQYLAGIIDEVCFKLKDSDGYVLYVQDSVDSSKLWLHGVGLILNESKQGTIASDLAVRHQTYVDTNGFEHYFVCYHKFFRSAFPVWGRDGEIGGILELFCNYYSVNTHIARQCMLIAAKIIENCVMREEYDFEKTQYFCEMLDSVTDSVCCMDRDGKILNLNLNLMKLWEIKERGGVVGESIENFLNLKNFDALKMYPQNIRIIDAIDLATKKNKRINVSTIYHPRKAEIYLLRIPQESSLIENKGWAAYEKIAVFNKETDYSNFGIENDHMGIIGNSPVIRDIKEVIKKIAPASATVLIEGATGTGKELVARAIHENSGVNGELIVVNCGAIPADLLQSELFGYVAGAFSGADRKGRVGKLEAAHNGTIFLDEIGDMPLDMQVSLLRFLEDHIVTRLGSNFGNKVNTRVIAATNKSLEHEVHTGNFREDLYYRLNVIKIDVPELANRKEDIVPIAQHFLDEFSSAFNHSFIGFNQESSYLLCSYRWPGNIRELKNVIQRIVLFADRNSAYVTAQMLPDEIKNKILTDDHAGAGDLDDSFQENSINKLQTEMILATLQQCNGNIAKAANILGIHRTTLYRRIKKLEKDGSSKTQ